MYLISVYFDEHTNKRINRYMNRIAEQTGNTFMTENNVPPHLTISSVEARSGELLIPHIEQLEGEPVLSADAMAAAYHAWKKAVKGTDADCFWNHAGWICSF